METKNKKVSTIPDKEFKRGIVVFLKNDKGFGFIENNDGISIFFHAKSVLYPEFNALKLGNEVEYLICSTNIQGKEIKAIGVRVIS